MTLESRINQNRYVGNGATKEFPFTFKAWVADNVSVYTGNGDTDVDVSGNCQINVNEDGGTVVFPVAPAVGTSIVIRRNMPYIQEDDYRNGTRFDSEEVEDRLDMDCAERQDLKREIDRCVKTPITSDMTPEQWWADFVSRAGSVQDALVTIKAWLDAIGTDVVGTATPVVASGSTIARTLGARFGDWVNVKDYGAKGDGATNDTVAFQAAGATGRLVLVPAGNYVVTAPVSGRFASLGGVRVSSDMVEVVDLSVLASHNPIDIMSGAADARVILRSDQRGSGPYSRAVVQAAAYDPVDNLVYMLHLKDNIPDAASASARYGSISRHRPSCLIDVGTADISADLVNVGHQGLAIEHIPGNGLRLWSSAQYGDNPCSVVRFSYNAGEAVSDFERYILVNASEMASSSLTPCISYDQRLLVVGYVKAGQGSLFLRIFRLQDLVEGGPGNYDGKQIVEFPVNPLKESGSRGFQGMACDSAYIYILASDTEPDTDKSAAIYCYSVQGEFIAKNMQVDLGFAESIANNSTFCEAEDLLLMPVDGRLSLVVAVNVGSGPENTKNLHLYAINATGYKSNPEFPKPVGLTNFEDLNSFSETGFFTKNTGDSVSNWPIGTNGFFLSIGNPSKTTFQIVGRRGDIDLENYQLAFRTNYNNIAQKWWYMPAMLAYCHVNSLQQLSGRNINVSSIAVVNSTTFTLNLSITIPLSANVIVSPTSSNTAAYGSASVDEDGSKIYLKLSAAVAFSVVVF